MNLASRSLATFSPIAFLFCVEDRRRSSLIGRALGSTLGRCSASSLGTPRMSAGFHPKMSQFSQRNWMSSASYLGSRVVEMLVGAAVRSVRWMLTFLISPADWNADSEAGFFARISSAGAVVYQCSLRSAIVMCWSAILEPCCKHSSALCRSRVMVMTPFGPGIFIFK